MRETVESVKDELSNIPELQSSAYMYVCDQVRRGVLPKHKLRTLCDWIKSGGTSVSASDIAYWIGAQGG